VPWPTDLTVLPSILASDFGAFRSQVVELRYFGGLNNEEIAGVLKISKNTVIRDWNMARAWLHSQLAGSASKVKIAGPISEVGHRLNIIWTTLAKRPNTYDFDPGLRGLAHRLGHVRAIFVAIHHSDVRTDEAKRFPTDNEASAALTHKLILRSVGRGVS